MRREHSSKSGGVLPSGYIQLEYIEGTGTQFIDTKVTGQSDIRLVLEFSWVEAGSLQVNGFGNSQNKQVVRLGCNGQNNFTYAAQTSGTWVYIDCGPVDSERHVFDIQSGSQKFDGEQISSNPISAWNRNFYLFATNDQWVNNTYNVQYFCKCRIYRCKFYSGNVLIRDLVPAMRSSDNKPGLYDIVNSKFYTNAGTGEFIYA